MRDVLTLTRPQADRLRICAILRICADLLWVVQAYAVAEVIAGWLRDGDHGVALVILFAATGVLRALLSYGAGRLVFDLGQRVVQDTRRRLLDAQTVRIDAALSSAEIAALVCDKIPLLAPYFTRFRLAMIRVRVVPVAFVLIALTQSWAVAIVLLVTGPLIPVFMALIGLAARDASARQMVEIGTVNRLLVDRIAALPDILLLGGFDRSRALFVTRVDALREKTMAVLRIAFLSSTVLELFSAIGVAMVALYVGFSLLGEITFGTWGAPLSISQGVFLLLLAPDFFQPLRDLAAAWHDKAAAEAVADELAGLNTAPALPILGLGAKATPLPGPVSICVEQADTVTRVRMPDFAIGPGESVALTGASGSGKSTCLIALAGLLPLSCGRITVMDQTLDAQNADAWRARLTLMPQHIHIPDTTLSDFLDPHGTKGDPGPALRIAHASDIVAALPHGLDTRLGELGAGVSGGEARRLLLARAFFSGADVILADEPTADLDAVTAGLIIDALRRAQDSGKTVIVASHDPLLIDAMDRAVALPEVQA
ncbi:ABC transporter ATP-binding protein/permease [Primorskyibacter marinus]|uniref:ABC transporter ATP-binding protein/permease n=1 Tax=Primorskyibacter marinus TaxID=1977320 RepID=UPI000E309F7C|nr:ATP-binding cassette domain-containing protein [Primorskyibacter marinus]